MWKVSVATFILLEAVDELTLQNCQCYSDYFIVNGCAEDIRRHKLDVGNKMTNVSYLLEIFGVQ